MKIVKLVMNVLKAGRLCTWKISSYLIDLFWCELKDNELVALTKLSNLYLEKLLKKYNLIAEELKSDT